MDLSTSIDAAYQQAEDTENTAIQIEARIIAAGGRPLLRQYGKPVDATAIKQNLTLVSQLNRRDPKLATYLGVQSGYQQQLELEQAARKAASEAMQAATAALKEQNDANPLTATGTQWQAPTLSLAAGISDGINSKNAPLR